MVKRKSEALVEEVVEEEVNDEERVVHTIDDDEEGGIRIGDIYIPPAPKPHCSNDAGGPRLIITNIVNYFFKSYANTVTLGPFHKSFSAIIGPNGSGKSNVIDSMLFVFGYRSSKIRSKKISSLIHNSNQYGQVQSCKVSVHFAMINDKDGDDYEIIPDTKFVIARTAFKDNSSYYEIDKKRVQFKDVAKLLKKYNVDLEHNRFLILQGEVEQIAMMKPKGATEHETGILEYLEDIIGTDRFKEPLLKLNEQVEELTEVRVIKHNRLKIIEKEKNELLEPTKEAIDFLIKENELTRLKNTYYQKCLKNFTEQRTLKEEENAGIFQEFENINTNLKEIKSSKDESTCKVKELQKQRDGIDKKRQKLQETLKNAENKDAQIRAEMTETNKRRKLFKQQLSDTTAKLTATEKLPEKHLADIKDLEKNHVKLPEQIAELKEKVADLRARVAEETKEIQEKRDNLQSKLSVQMKDVEAAKYNVDLLQHQLELSKSKEEEESKKLENMKKLIEDTSEKLSTYKKEVAQLKENVPIIEKKLIKSEEELASVSNEEKQITLELNTKRAKLEESRSQMRETKSRNAVLDALTRQCEEGNLRGFLGRLGDLGAVDPKYDIAVSTACGPLDYIVTENVACAEACLAFLKNNRIGRTNIIALDKQEHLREAANNRISTPENVPRVYDLIKVNDERVRTAFYYGLRNTLLAKDLEQATRIAYGSTRYRVVTLNGELIEAVGTMSGGGNRVNKGRIGTKLRASISFSEMNPSKLKEIEQNIEELNGRAEFLRKKQTKLESEVVTLKMEYTKIKNQLETSTLDLQSKQKQLPTIQKQYKEQEKVVANSKSDEKEIKKLTADLQSKKNAYDKVNAAAEKLRAQVDELNKEIAEKGDGKVKPVQKKLSDLTSQSNKIEKEKSRLQLAIKTAERNISNFTENIKNYEQDISDCEKKLLQMQEERNEIEKDAKELFERVNKLTEEVAEFDKEIASISSQNQELIDRENKLKSEKVDINNKMKEINKVLDSLKNKEATMKRQIEDLKLHEIPQLDLKTIDSENNLKLETYTDEKLESIQQTTLETQIGQKAEHLKHLKPNIGIIQEYKVKLKLFVERVKEFEECNKKQEAMRRLYNDLKQKRHNEFLHGFHIINLKLKEIYLMITLGGDAELELVDTMNPFSDGISFSVRPPKKSWKNISNLSGGEKTLSSLALVFALHYFNPSPLYVMDEIDAALDFKNVSIIANYIKEKTKNSQFIIISLRSNMFELANRLTGIYKVDNCSASVTINTIHQNNGMAIPNESTNDTNMDVEAF